MMKQLGTVLAVLLFSLSLPLPAQTFEYVIIIVQENRTPDQLFGASGLAGADLQINTKLGKAVDISGGADCVHSYAGFRAEVAGTYTKACYDYVVTGAQPYWNMAAEYGWANYFFQTNQGPSFPAHEFLVGGTSAPSDSSPAFNISNATQGGLGCKAAANSLVTLINPNGSFSTVFPCFTTSSLIDLLVANGLTWRYYVSGGHADWNAPGALKTWHKSKSIIANPPQILSDIANGTLANVSWVTPASAYSDHPGNKNSGGPAWVASIVNAVGSSPYWQNTAIFVTWDDWGGQWDHVAPLANNTGWCKLYCYGFRVPLLVISAETPQGYVDNGVHDFGSILHFVESNFGLGQIGPGGWADAWADDLSAFFVSGTNRRFVKVNARKLTKRELADQGEPDTD